MFITSRSKKMPKRPSNNSKKYGKKPKKSSFDPRKKYLCPGNIGFLVSYTKNRDDKNTAMDIFGILNKFEEPKNDQQQDDAQKSMEKSDKNENSDSDSDTEIFDIQKALNKEIQKTNTKDGADSDLPQEKEKKPKTTYKYNRLDPEVKNIMFISTTSTDPKEVLKTSLKMFTCQEILKIKNFSKILPVIGSCKISNGSEGNLDEVSDCVKDLVKKGIFDFKILDGWFKCIRGTNSIFDPKIVENIDFAVRKRYQLDS